MTSDITQVGESVLLLTGTTENICTKLVADIYRHAAIANSGLVFDSFKAFSCSRHI